MQGRSRWINTTIDGVVSFGFSFGFALCSCSSTGPAKLLSGDPGPVEESAAPQDASIT
jgi:hypothetical protein